MNQKQQLELVEQINAKGIELLKSKGHDYAGEDILKNFKQLNAACELFEIDVSKIEGVHMFYILIKIQRICNLLFSGKQGKNESIQDTLIDLRNYVDLLNCTLTEKNEK
jgi:hypothetical protein